MKKVLFVATVVKTHVMVFHLPYLKWLKENGYEVHVAAKNDYEDRKCLSIPFCDKYYDIGFERSPFKLQNVRAYKLLKGIIDTNEYEIIHCHTPVGGAIGRIAARKSRSKGTRIIYTAHGFHFYSGAPMINWMLYYPMERLMARFTDVLITINQEDYLRSITFKSNKKLLIPGVGLDVDRYISSKSISLGIGKQNLSNDNTVRLIMIGELNKNKNHRVILEALSTLKTENWDLSICGDGPLKEYLQALAVELQIKDKVNFLGYRNDIDELLSNSDIFLFPSFREGLPLSVMEAMASSLPVVCSHIRGNIDLIEHCEGGYLVKSNDPIEYSNYIKLLIANEHIRIKFGEFNHNKVQKYSINNVLSNVAKIYEEKTKMN